MKSLTAPGMTLEATNKEQASELFAVLGDLVLYEQFDNGPRGATSAPDCT